MKKIFLATTGLAMLSGIGAASAADLPTRKGPPMAPVYVPPAFTWTGFYVGVNAGYAWANGNNRNNSGFPFFGAVPNGGFFPVSNSSNNGGFVGGVQAGYNYQFGVGQGFVVGVEADIDYANFGRRNNNLLFGSFTLPQFPGTVFTPVNLATKNNSNDFIGTARLRAGYAWDRLLVYGTGGLAYGGTGNNRNNFGGGFTATTAAGSINPVSGAAGPSTAFVGGVASRGSSTRVGWTLGAGLEYAIWQNWSIKAEYLYANFGHSGGNATIFLPGAVAVTNKNRDSNVSIVRLGLNYRF
jgi:outer membrane immunogenic protein